MALSSIAFEEHLMMNCPFDCSFFAAIVSYAASFALCVLREGLQKAQGFKDGAFGSRVALDEPPRMSVLWADMWRLFLKTQEK